MLSDVNDHDGYWLVYDLILIKDELKTIFKTEVDFVSDSNKKIMKDLIYV